MSKARNLSDFISDATIDSTEIADLSVTHAKLHTDMNLSSKTLTFAANQISGNSVDGGVISNFASTGIDDNSSSTSITLLGSGTVGVGGTSSSYGKLTITQSTDASNGGLGIVDSGNALSARLFSTGTAITLNAGNTGTGKLVLNAGGGNVGIGTDNPTGALTVSGIIKTIDGTDIDMDATASGQLMLDGSGYAGAIALNTQGMNIYTNSGSRDIIFGTDEIERVRIDSSGGVGINTNDAIEYMLDVGRDNLAYTSGKTMRINSVGDTIFSLSRQGTSLMSMRNDNTGYTCISSNNSSKLMLGFGTGDAGAINNHLYFTSGETIVNDLGQDRDFRVESDTNTHALFVDGGADMVCFGTSNNTGLAVQNSETGVQITSSGRIFCSNADHHDFNRTSNGDIIRFRRDTTIIGGISSTTAGTTYSTTSDRRLKDNIEPIADATDKLMDMKPVTHTWIDNPDEPQVHGFIAQEMQEVVPEAVSGDAESDEMMSMDYGRITPVIVAALQDALKEIKELKTRIDELESK
jgi:hypothetical protein